MNVRWTVSLVACVAMLLCGALPATAAEPAMQGSAGIIQNSTLIGATVLNPQGQRLGQIKDVLLDPQSGQATFVILDAEVSKSNRAMLVVPFQALRVSFNSADNRLSVALDLRPDQLRVAPQIQSNQWEKLQNPQFLEQARGFYQPRTYTAARPIDNPSAASAPSACPLPPPCATWGNSDRGWTEEMEEFSME